MGTAQGGEQVLRVAASNVGKGVQGTGPRGLALPVPRSQLREEAVTAKAEAEKKAAALKVISTDPAG